MNSKHFYGKLLVLAFTLLWIISGTAMAEMKVYDADDQFLGILLGVEEGPLVYLSSLDMIVTLNTDETVSPKGKYSDASTECFYYTAADCAGTPYVYGGYGNAKVIYKKGGTSNYYSLDIGTSNVFTPASYCDQSGVCNNASGPHGEAFYFRVQSVTLPFSTPVKHPFKWEYTESKSKVVVIPLND
jgi:hypothetical protein